MTRDVIIIGAGFSGIGMAIHLDRAGRRDWLVLESADRLGGTWRDNAYPGAACDVPSHLYSYSFELNPDWGRVYAEQGEILAYMERCADRYGLRDRIRFGATVEEARWDADASVWHVRIAGETLTARFVVFAVGALRDPRWPSIPGLETFAGPVVHSARWDPSLELAGKRVGIVGTGASAIQIVPALAGRVARQTVFQRTAPWVKARMDRPFTEGEKRRFRWPLRMQLERLRIYASMESRYPLVFGRHRLTQLVERQLTREMRTVVTDPALAEKLRPDYRAGCKRILSSDDWYPALTRDDVDVETRAIARAVPDGLELDDGRHVPLDVLVCCTGFTVDAPLGALAVHGVGGRDLEAAWGTRPRAFNGTTMAGYPNAFVLFGPNTGLGHTSMIVMIEAQIRYVMAALAHVEAHGHRWMDVTQAALDTFVAEMDRRHRERVWMSGCNSWYLGPDGVNFTIWPGSTLRFLARMRRFDPAPYRFG
ncbi:MAG: NAD(P)/FAD-dependent oxidoreductase [Alphaproteobacteria bacterium]|nr:NAD(P)/FAD-dependent oxidoreductase [Alphaproteobacteria bacterium]